MAESTNITPGVKLIKISKTDALGNDFTSQLQEAKLLSLLFDDLGTERFEIYSVAEYPTYYLYSVVPQSLGIKLTTIPQITSLSGPGSGFIASNIFNFPGSGGSIIKMSRFSGMFTANNKSNFSLNTSTGVFTSIASQTNYSHKVSYTGSIYSNTTSGNSAFKLTTSGSGFTVTDEENSLSTTTPGVGILTSANSGSANAVDFSGSFKITMAGGLAKKWGIEFQSWYSGNTFFIPQSGFEINMESLASGSTDTDGLETIVEPYIDSTFNNSDFNAVLNNAEDSRDNEFYMDVDYSSDAIIAVNADEILSNSATRAKVQYSNYTSERVTRPRYDGSRSTSPGFNLESNEGGLGSLPNVEQDRAYFAYFNYVGGTSPEWGNGLQDRSGLSIRYFIDSEGRVLEPTNDNNGVNLGICRQTFTENETGVLSFDDESGAAAAFSNLIGEQTIFKSGKSIAPIIYTQTASISNTSPGGYTGSIEFGQGDLTQSGSIDDFTLYANTAATYNTAVTVGNSVPFPDIANVGTSQSLNSPYTEAINLGNPSSDNVTLYITFQLNGKAQNRVGNFAIYKNGSSTGVTGQIDGNNAFYRSLSLSYTDASSTSGDSYEVRLTSTSDGLAFTLINSPQSYFRISQQPLPTLGDCQRFWTQSGVSSNQIKALGVGTGNEGGLKQFYGQKQKDISGSGFFPITLDFVVEPGDEIRFEGTETQSYTVLSVDTSGGEVILNLDRDVTANNLDWFLLRRYIDTPGSILIEADKPAGGTSPGFFMPLYATKGIEDNFDKIIQNLKTDQLI